MPSEAASLQPSSRLVPRANTPLVTLCFKRPFFMVGAGVCASAAEAAKAGRNSLRRMMHEYHSASAKRKLQRGGKPENVPSVPGFGNREHRGHRVNRGQTERFPVCRRDLRGL